MLAVISPASVLPAEHQLDVGRVRLCHLEAVSGRHDDEREVFAVPRAESENVSQRGPSTPASGGDLLGVVDDVRETALLHPLPHHSFEALDVTWGEPHVDFFEPECRHMPSLIRLLPI